MPYVGILQAAGLKKESVLGTLATPPTEYLPIIPPDSFTEAIALLESKGIRAQPDAVIKAVQGPASLKNGKVKIEIEPENCGNLFMAAFGTDTKTGPTNTTVYTHTFTRASVAQLPTYSWWFQKGAKYFQFAGCMMSKMVIAVKAKELVTMDTEWTALTYDDTGSSHSPTYSALKPFKFSQGVVSIDGTQVNDYEDLEITIDNMVEADHALSNSIYPAKIYSKGMRVTLSATLYLENTTQWAKFLAGTSAHFNLVLTSGENVSGSSPATAYSLTIDVPTALYTAAPLAIEDGILKVRFTAVAVYDSGTTKTISVALANSVSSAY